MTEATHYEAAIIGGGFAGLSAAALLSKQGKRVLLIEKSARLGGRASYYDKDGFVWQYGQHSHRLAKDGIAARVFERLGAPLDFIHTSADSAYLYFNGKLYPRPEGPLAFLKTPMLPLRSRLNFMRFYLRLLKQDPADWYDRTLLGMYRTWYRDPNVERFLSFVGFTVMIPDPAMASAGEVMAFLQRAKNAAVKQGEPRGGSKQVIDKLHGIATRNGCEIRLSEPVESITVSNGRAVGVQTKEREYRAESVVSAVPLFDLFERLDTRVFGRKFVRYVENMQSSSGLSIDFVSNEPLSRITGGILGVGVPLWVKFQSNIDPSIAPEGRHVCTWAMLFEPGAEITDELAAKTEARIKGIMEDLFPGSLA